MEIHKAQFFIDFQVKRSGPSETPSRAGVTMTPNRLPSCYALSAELPDVFTTCSVMEASHQARALRWSLLTPLL